MSPHDWGVKSSPSAGGLVIGVYIGRASGDSRETGMKAQKSPWSRRKKIAQLANLIGQVRILHLPEDDDQGPFLHPEDCANIAKAIAKRFGGSRETE